MITQRNLNKYISIVEKSFKLSKDNGDFFTGLHSAGVHFKGSIDENFLKENKIKNRDVNACHVYEYNGTKIWYMITRWSIGFSTRDPFGSYGGILAAPGWNWRAEAEYLSKMKEDTQVKSTLIPKSLHVWANIHGIECFWTYNYAESCLLGEEPCLIRVEQLSNK